MKKSMKGIMFLVFGAASLYVAAEFFLEYYVTQDISEINGNGGPLSFLNTIFFMGGIVGLILGIIFLYIGWKNYKEADLEKKYERRMYSRQFKSGEPVIVQRSGDGTYNSSYRLPPPPPPDDEDDEIVTAEPIKIQPKKAEKVPEKPVVIRSRGEMIREYEAIFNITSDRAANLFDSGYRRTIDIALAELDDLIKVNGINPTIAKKIKRTARILERVRD